MDTERDETDKINIEQLLKEGRTICVMPQGNSMYPMIVPGRDSVIVAPFCPSADKRDKKNRIRRGDVVLYRRDNSILVIHRVFRVARDGYYMVGDNQTQIEGPLGEERLRGRLVGFIRKGREYSVKYPPYRIYAGLWLLMRPFRPAIAKWIHSLRVKLHTTQ